MSELDPETSYASRRVSRGSGRGRRLAPRVFGVGVFLIGVAAVFAVVAASLHLRLPFGINAPHRSSADGSPSDHGTHGHSQGLNLKTAKLAALVAPASRVAAVAQGSDGALFLGGYDAGGAPTDTIQTLTDTSVHASGTLPGADASAVAATLAQSVYLFGGIGSTIYQVTPTGTNVVGSLPTATADAAIATVGDTAYIIGGYTGTSDLNTIVAFTPPGTLSVVATLPVPLRLATATALDGLVYIIGGATNGVASATVYRFDPATKTVTTFTQLPHARESESAATLDGKIIVAGGKTTPTAVRTRAIYVLDPHTRAVSLGGLLPIALSGMAAVDGQNQVLLAGGSPTNGDATDSIYSVTLKGR
ncbi:MAG TPA: kelch repeat-containing protein [Solirubrobacteraceae bacterium]|jgi:hypothetical protein